MKIKTLLLILLLGLLSFVFLRRGHAQSADAPGETRYLNFQVMTGLHGYSGPRPDSGHYALSKAQLEDFVHSVTQAVGMTGDSHHKLGFTVGPLCFDMSDEETRRFIRDAFAVARENDVAVAFHIDDSMSWSQRKDLLSNPDNIETADWKQIPSMGRRADWGRTPTKFPPQMCFNSPAIVAAVKDRAALIGAEIKQEIAALQSEGKTHLFAGVISGWETYIGQDFDTNRSLGYRALSHRGFSESDPPKDPDLERVQIVREFVELWANSLHAGGVPKEKIFCHIAFTSQGLRAPDAQESYLEKVHFAPGDVAFDSAYRPGFSTYPEGATFKEIHATLAAHGSPGWISGEGVNVSPTGMPGEPNMETYLAKMFNHGAVLTNVFSWGMGGEAMKNSFFRKATENPEALAAYGKFLRGEPLVESAAQGFSSAGLQEKMHRIQAELPDWIGKSGQRAQAEPLMKRIQALVKEKKWLEVDQAADELLALMKGDVPPETKPEASTLAQRLPAKIHRIQAELPAWLEKTGNTEAAALMKKMQGQIKAKDWQEVEKTADSILKMMDGSAPDSPSSGIAQSTQEITEEVRDKLAHNLGSSFLLFRTKVLAELKVTPEQKEKLDQCLQKLLPDAMQALQKGHREREKYNQQTHEERAATLQEILSEDQRARLHQLELQKDLLFGPAWNMKELQITDEQQKQFIGPTQEADKKTIMLMQEIHQGANPDEIRPKALQVRLDLEVKLESLLTDAQKKKWKEMLGQPVDLGVIYGGL